MSSRSQSSGMLWSVSRFTLETEMWDLDSSVSTVLERAASSWPVVWQMVREAPVQDAVHSGGQKSLAVKIRLIIRTCSNNKTLYHIR